MPRRNRKSGRHRTPPSPLRQHFGIDPVHVRTPDADEADATWATLRDHLLDRLPVGPQVLDELIARRGIVTENGEPIRPATPYGPGIHLWFHRELPTEPLVPFPLRVVHRDERLLVVDKPHFLATTPRGRHVTQTALALLRHRLGLPELSPAHRLDRLTAGLIMFTISPEHRGAYQLLFQQQQVHKEYEAIAPYRPELALPRTVRSHIQKIRGVMAAQELTDRPPNSETRVQLLENRGPLARYRLLPRTGRTHQLRVHLNSLGVPILGDTVYPVLLDPDPADFSRPLQLLARVLEFTDPVTGDQRRFESSRTLAAWDDPAAWAARPGPADGPPRNTSTAAPGPAAA